MRARLSPEAALVVMGEWIWLPWQPTLASYQLTGGLRWRFSEALAVSVTGALYNAGPEAQLGMFVYY